MMAQSKEKAFPAGLLIRHDIVHTVLMHTGKSVKLPSARQLADRFGVSQRTAASELANLVEEGWIFGRKGIGYFSNPEKNGWYMRRSRKIAGLGWGDTKNLCYEYNEFALISHIGMALPPSVAYPRMLFVNTVDPDGAGTELRSAGLDAIVWGTPSLKWQKILQNLHRDGIPVVTLLKKTDKVPFIGIDSFEAGRKIARELDWSHPGLVLWCDAHEEYSSPIRKGLLAEMPEPSRFRYVDDPLKMPAELERLVAAGTPPAALYGGRDFAPEIYTRHGLDFFRTTQVISDWSFVRDNPEFHGICHRYPFEKFGATAAEMLRRQFEKQPVSDVILEWEIIKK